MEQDKEEVEYAELAEECAAKVNGVQAHERLKAMQQDINTRLVESGGHG